MNKPKATFLEVDSSKIEENLHFIKHEYEDELSNIFGSSSSEQTSDKQIKCKIVKPVPGFCIKAFRVDDNEKIFINICQTDGIPAPKDITEAELMEILNSEYPNSFKIPMSIGEPHTTPDKSGKSAMVCDIAVNPKFFNKVEAIKLFRDFLTALVFEALDDKYKIQCKEDNWLILKNRKCMGKLITHRIENRDVKKVNDYYGSTEKSLIEDITSTKQFQKDDKKILIQEIEPQKNNPKLNKEVTNAEKLNKNIKTDIYIPNPTKLAVSQANTRKPHYRLIREPDDGDVKQILGEFYMPECISANEISLDIGEDRIVVEARKRGYLLEGFFEQTINADRAEAQFDTGSGVLTVTMPVISAQ